MKHCKPQAEVKGIGSPGCASGNALSILVHDDEQSFAVLWHGLSKGHRRVSVQRLTIG